MRTIGIVIYLFFVTNLAIGSQLPTIVRDTVVGEHEIKPYYYDMGLVNKYGGSFSIFPKFINNSSDTAIIDSILFKPNVHVTVRHWKELRVQELPFRIAPNDSVIIMIRIRLFRKDDPDIRKAGDIIDNKVRIFVDGSKNPYIIDHRMEITDALFDRKNNRINSTYEYDLDFIYNFNGAIFEYLPGIGSLKNMVMNRRRLDLKVVSIYNTHGVSFEIKNNGVLECYYKSTGVPYTKEIYIFEFEHNSRRVDDPYPNIRSLAGLPMLTFVLQDENGEYHILTRREK